MIAVHTLLRGKFMSLKGLLLIKGDLVYLFCFAVKCFDAFWFVTDQGKLFCFSVMFHCALSFTLSASLASPPLKACFHY